MRSDTSGTAAAIFAVTATHELGMTEARGVSEAQLRDARTGKPSSELHESLVLDLALEWTAKGDGHRGCGPHLAVSGRLAAGQLDDLLQLPQGLVDRQPHVLLVVRLRTADHLMNTIHLSAKRTLGSSQIGNERPVDDIS